MSDSKHTRDPWSRRLGIVKTLEQVEMRGRGRSLVVPPSASAVRMRSMRSMRATAVVSAATILGAAPGMRMR